MKHRNSLGLLIAIVGIVALPDTASAYLKPKIGRWLSRDPIGEPGAIVLREAVAATQFLPRDFDEGQPYHYVQNSPTNGYDPLGDVAMGLAWLDGLDEPTSQPSTQPSTQPGPWSNDPDCCKTKQYDKWGWVECCKGAPTICLGKVGLKYVSPVQRCLLLHEGGHKSDLPADYCKCKKDGFPAGSDFSDADRQASECKAFRSEKTCLDAVNCKDMPSSKDRRLCSSQRADRLRYINNYLKKHCGEKPR